MLYRVLRVVARLALRWFYRDIEVLDADRLPHGVPLLVAGNHPNALVDALVIGTTVPWPVRITAKATLLEHPIMGLLARGVGIVPLRRSSDERARDPQATPDPARNAEAFAAILDVLAQAGTVLLFPEGKSHSESELAPLRSGLARIALLARDTRAIRDLMVVPIGLTFERKWEPRTHVLVQIGVPIAIDEIPGVEAEAVTTLTRRLDRALREVTLNFRSRDDAERVLHVSRLLARLLDSFRPLGAPDPPLSETVRLARRVENIRRGLPEADPAFIERALLFTNRLDALRAETARLDVEINDLAMSLSPAAGAWFVIRELSIIATAGPLALWGRINHWVPLRLARAYASRVSRSPDDPAMMTIVSGLVLVLVFYGLQTAAVGMGLGWGWALLYALSLPLLASWDFRFTERLRRVLRRVRTYLLLRGQPALQEGLRSKAADLRHEAEALDGLAETLRPTGEVLLAD